MTPLERLFVTLVLELEMMYKMAKMSKNYEVDQELFDNICHLSTELHYTFEDNDPSQEDYDQREYLRDVYETHLEMILEEMAGGVEHKLCRYCALGCGLY